MKRFSRGLLLTLASLGTLVVSPAVAPAEMVIKFSHVVAATGNPKGEAAQLFADCANQRLAGKVKMEVYPNSQLYNDDKVLEALLLGDVHFAAPSLSKFEQFTKKFRIFDLPFLFADLTAVDRFQKSPAGQQLLHAMDDQGILGLAYWHNGMKQLSANRPLLVPADARGLKFRIQQSDVLAAQFEALGAVPQKMAFAEVYGALQQGVVDGQENTWSNIYTKKFHEVQDGITETNHGVIDYLVVTSRSWWEGLPADIRAGLQACLDEATAAEHALSGRLDEEAKQKLLAAGVQIRQLTPEQRQAWVDAMKPVWEKFKDEIGQELIEAALAANEAS